jgi:hypothetical protein
MLAIILPTRGLVFTEVEEQIETIRLHLRNNCIVFHSHNFPIPDCHNILTERALLIPEVNELFFVEEDVICDDRTSLLKLLNDYHDISFIDYAVNGWACSTKNKKNEILWCGLGMTKIKRNVFDKLDKPWFRNDKSFRLNTMQWVDQPCKYGGQDIWFFLHAREKGFSIYQIEGECRHLQIKALGKSGINQGLHEIIERPKIEKRQFIDLAS